MDQQALPEDRRVFPRVLAALVKYARETVDGDREMQLHSHLRKPQLPAVRQTQFDRTGTYRQPSIVSFTDYGRTYLCNRWIILSSNPGLTKSRASGKPFSKRCRKHSS